jgi:LPS-assembly lipoprotein
MTVVFSCARFAGLMAGLLLLSACQVRPLYQQPPTSQMSAVQDKLSAIQISLPQDRATQLVRNALLFQLKADTSSADLYRLDLTTSQSVSDVSVEIVTGSPTSKTLTLNTNFVLIDLASGDIITRGVSFADVSYDWSLQRFANTRAEQNALERAAQMVADDISLRLAAFLAAHAS